MTDHSTDISPGTQPRIPHGIRWSAATAAFQIEGARDQGGRGRTIWDDFVDTPGAVIDGATADPGPGSYHRFHEDVDLAKRLGLDRYRFGISWARIVPDGSGTVNRQGLDYYSRLVDALIEAGVTPFPTLYHWDLPSPLEAAGGWLNRDTAYRLEEYAAAISGHLGDRVKHWYTINEPAMTALEGYAIGTLAPARQELFGALPAAHHQLLAHGLAMRVLREAGAEQVGLTNNHTLVRPQSDSPEDMMAAGAYNMIHNRVFADPVLTGQYPELAALGLPEMPTQPGDMELISAGPDFYGVNYYNPTTVAAAPEGSPLPFDLVPTPGAETTGFGEMWPIVPEALTAMLTGLRDDYGDALPPIIIAENGASFPEPDRAAKIDDTNRISYLAGHIQAVANAIAAGVNVEEYTVWSLIDNFEWAAGYTQRFGLTHVDYETGERTPKVSFDWLCGVIERSRT
ncbi:GH1 family beta-glucosidase [Leucobacter salsicius]|uniref:GH1 family beta-glucosidase n=1 Tax=Leucobacter salsicius TaxID=664638 RepID=UPI00034B0096|nr:GH1 family beta-glucosidase [Leucobacter salsicius]